MMTNLFRAGFWVPLVICTYLALVPEPPQHPVFRLGDVVLHAAAFTYLTFALVLATAESASRARTYMKLAAWMLAYGLGLEVAQSFIAERSAEIKDLLVDVFGIGVGLLVASVLEGPVRRLAARVAGG